MKNIVLTIVCLSVLLSMPLTLFAYTMSSSNYRIDSDSVNTGGSSYSTSANYSLGDSVGQIGPGTSSSTSYTLNPAGFWTDEDVYISLNATGNVSLGAISGLTGGTATGSASYVVTTNSGSGYQLLVAATSSPAMKATGSSIADYAPSGADPDFNFVITSTDARFGFSPEGPDIVARFKDNGSACNAGSGDTANVCWDGFSTSQKTVAQSASANAPTGATTTIKYRVQIGSNKVQDNGADYSASITVTAVTL